MIKKHFIRDSWPTIPPPGEEKWSRKEGGGGGGVKETFKASNVLVDSLTHEP